MEPRAVIERWLDRTDLRETLQSLVRIPSVTGEEDAAQAYLAGRLEGLGGRLDCWRVEPEALRGRPGFPGCRIARSRLNLVASFEGSCPGPTLILNGHIDTVTPGQPERWSGPPYDGRLSEGRVYGRGACDMKGGLAAILAAVRAVRSSGLRLRGRLLVQSVIGEEDGGVGTFAALERGHRGDAVIVCEPTRLAVVPAQAGVTLFRITVRGQSAHGCVRQEGVSALERFLPVHAALLELEQERNRRLRHPLFAGTDCPWPLSIGLLRAGEWPAIVPESLSCEGRLGVAVGESLARARGELEEAVRRAAAADPWLQLHPPSVEWIGGVWEGAETPLDHPIVASLSRSLAALRGRPAAVEGAPYGSDLRLFTNRAAIPGVLFGPGDIRLAHFTDEYVRLEEVAEAAICLGLTILEYCGVAA